MFHILDFIDSPDIREYNKDTQFTPAEQAILIARSCGTTLEEKIAAMQELVDSNTEETYQTENIKMGWRADENKHFSDMAANTLKLWKNILTRCKERDKVVYIAYIIEKEYIPEDWQREFQYFSTYDLAYQYLLEQKNEYKEDTQEDETFEGIRCVYLDGVNDYDEFLFDNELRLITVRPSCQMKKEFGLIDEIEESCYMHVPLPFKKGDLIMVKNPFDATSYGVMPGDAWTKEKDIHFLNDFGDGSDMFVSLDVYNENFVHKFDYTDGTPVLDLYLCKEDELPETEKMLKEIREVRLGELDWMVLLYRNT